MIFDRFLWDEFPCCHHLKPSDSECIDPVVFSMRADEFDERDTSWKIERDDHPVVASRNFKPRAFTVENFCRGRRKTISSIELHLADLTKVRQRSRGVLASRMPFSVGGKDVPSDNSHGRICSQNGNNARPANKKRRGNNPAASQIESPRNSPKARFSRSRLFLEHDLRANATRLSRGKPASHFSGSCSRSRCRTRRECG